MNKAIFLDRDGVINELVYNEEHGLMDSPYTVEQMTLLPGVEEAIQRLAVAGYKIVIISNQPGIAKGYISQETFEQTRQKMKGMLAKEGVVLDGEYYCFHHPEAKVKDFRMNCDCRKPKPGLILRAAREMKIDLGSSWVIGDGLTDIRAGRDAGCKTILLGKMKCELCSLMDEMDSKPDMIVSKILDMVPVILRQKGTS